VLFVNQTEYGNARYRFAGLRLPAHQRALRPDLKKYTALRFRQDVKRHLNAAGPGAEQVVVMQYLHTLGSAKTFMPDPPTNRVDSGACWVEPKQHLAPIWRDDTVAALLHLLQ
jgi:hypothetical protein